MPFLDLSVTEVEDKLKEGVVTIAKLLHGVTASVHFIGTWPAVTLTWQQPFTQADALDSSWQSHKSM